MSQSLSLDLPLQGRANEYASAKAASIPWTIWCMVAGLTSGMIGGVWDISWHMSIGRDSFWTPAHIFIQLTGVLVGIAGAYMILHTTFAGSSAERDASVQVMGFRAPVGAFIAVWGCVAMLASAPFDNWWHNAYGLDVKIVSPPHILLSFGSFAIKIGTLALIASVMNRSEGALRRHLTWLFVFLGGMGVAQLSALIIIDPTWLQNQHRAICYLAVALFIPTFLIGTGWGTVRGWGCTMVASVYTVLGLAAEWILPLFPAQPKLGPVYQNVTHLLPLRFPLLFIVPAIVADLLLRKLDQRSASRSTPASASFWLKATVVGPAIVLSFMVVQWPFANFLVSPAARNRIFGSHYFAYFDPAGFLYDPYKFQPTEKTGVFLTLMAIALAASVLTTRLGLGWGEWMRRVRR